MTILHRIKTSAYRFYYRKISRTKWKIVQFLGAEFVMQPSNYIDRRMWVEGGYEKSHLSYLLSQARKGAFDAFIDIGANFGLYTCVLGTSNVASEVHSFECDPRNLNQLHGHLRMNDLLDVVNIHPYAVGDVEGWINFRMASRNSTGHSYVSESRDNYEVIHLEKQSNEYKTIVVQQKTIDNVLKFRKKELLIKIDVEGYEIHVLKGMEKILQNNLCLLQVEIVNQADELVEMLSKKGYDKVHRIEDDWYFSNLGCRLY